MAAALGTLRAQPQCDPRRVAAIGYCFGGTTVLELARSGADLSGVVSFHGGLQTAQPAERGRVRAKVLVLHGADDPHVPPKEVEAFEDEGNVWASGLIAGLSRPLKRPTRSRPR